VKTESKLERILASGQLAVTGECGPPRGSVARKVIEKAELLRGCVDAVNVTDNQTAMVRMSSFAACLLIKQMGLNPLLQMVTRDRNRLSMQSDILGAYAHGIDNMLCLSGDHPHFGDHPMAANVHDIDSVQMIAMVKRMRDDGLFQGGEKIDGPPKMFIGAAANPFADPFELRVARLAKKVKAGVDFIQTQCIYNVDRFAKWMEGVRERGLHKQVYILAGVTPIKSAGMARYMKNSVPGMDVPEELVKRVAGVPKEKQAEEGIKICLETIERLRGIEGVSGIHLMAIEWEHRVREIVERAGFLPRPQFDQDTASWTQGTQKLQMTA
jgi:methylenetetrahydrofolate reductase (NADPH)